MSLAITRAYPSVAFTGSLPVDVLIKSAPAIMQTALARATFVNVPSSPVARMALTCASPHASRNCCISSYSAVQSPRRTWALVMTMSISAAPSWTDAWISWSLWANGESPAGKPVLTAATGIPEPFN